MQKQGKTVGLITGSFDIIHLGYLKLFEFAKKKVNYFIVGLDSDNTIRSTKGDSLPINDLYTRGLFLTHIIEIDSIFFIETESIHGSAKARESYESLLKRILPTHIITHKKCDRHWKDKQKIAMKLSIKLSLDNSRKITSSGEIIQSLQKT